MLRHDRVEPLSAQRIDAGVEPRCSTVMQSPSPTVSSLFASFGVARSWSARSMAV